MVRDYKVLIELRSALEYIIVHGWCKNYAFLDDDRADLIGALAGKRDGRVGLDTLSVLAETIYERCEKCAPAAKSLLSEKERPVQVIVLHNDMHMESQDDAIILLKQTIERVEKR